MVLSLLAATLVAASPLSPLPIPAPHFTDGMKLTRASPTGVQALRISLQMRDRTGVDALIAAQRDPASPLYRQWLTPAQFGERFGQSAADYQRLLDLLQGAGLTLRPFHNRMYVEAVGTVGQVEKLIGVHLVDVEQQGQPRFRSFQGTPRLPASVAPMIISVGGLDTRQRFHHRLFANGANTFGPQDLRRYYDIDALHAQGYGGQLSSVALVGALPDPSVALNVANVQFFYDAVSDSTATPLVDSLPQDNSGTDGEPGINVEEEMDMEMPTVAAPLMKTVTMVLAPPDTLFVSGFNEVNENLPNTTAVSTSFGGCEANEQGAGQGDIDATQDVIAQGTVEGIAYFDAAGDSGAADCSNEFMMGSATAAVDFPSSVPYLTAVGGTMYTGTFDTNHGITTYGGETTWNEQGEAAGGGGVSILFDQPWYQHAPGTTDGGARQVPDIALLADISPGVAIVDQVPGLIDNDGNGTSDASPLAAGMFALVNDYIGGCRLGSAAPELYALGRIQYHGGNAVFNDITTGNNSLDGVTGFAAGVGYDEATGLGSLDVTALAQAWPPCPVAPAAGVDGGPLADAGQIGFSDGGSVAGWVAGYAQDAGSRVAYDPCTLLGCSGANVACVVTPEGPAACVVSCDPSSANSCSAGDFCAAAVDGGGVCTPGCATNSDCVALPDGGGAGDVCLQCANACLPPGNDAGPIGAACNQDSDCQTGDQCIPAGYGFPGGYCTLGCPGACDCGPGATCDTGIQACLAICSVSHGGPCRSGYVCDPQDTTDVGTCLPACTSDQDCGFLFAQGATCDTAIGGVCVPSGVTPPTLTSSSSGSSASSGSTSSSTASSSSGASSTGSTSSGAASTSIGSSTGNAVASTSGASTNGSAGSSSGHSSTSSGASTSSGSTHSSTGTSTAASTGASTGTTGASSSNAGTKGGCGCDAGAGPEALWGLLVAASFAASRRRRG